MAIEIGAVVEGEVTGITNFGAFLQLPGGKVGLIHISEVSNVYVKDIHDFLKEHQKVRAKVRSKKNRKLLSGQPDQKKRLLWRNGAPVRWVRYLLKISCPNFLRTVMTGCWIYAEIRNPSAVAVVRAVIGKKQALRKGAFFVFLAGVAG